MKKALNSDKVHVVDCDRSRESTLAPEDVEVLDEIATGCGRTHDEIVEIALRRLWCELNSSRRHEVIDEVRQEIEYRQWCDRVHLLR